MTVLELITGRLARMLAGTVPVLTGLEAVNAAVNVIGLELVRRKSDLALQEISLIFSAESQTLPDGFVGFVGHPVVVDGYELTALPDLDTALELRGSTGDPQYYDIMGSVMMVYPAPASTATIKATAKIIPVLDMSDDLPWLGLLNDLIAAAAVQVSQQGVALLAAPPFLAMIDKGVNAVLVPRMKDLPRKRPINYF